MKKLLTIAIAIFILSIQVEAQLLVDNQSRLKTAKVKSSGFLFFRSKKKVKTSTGANKQKVVGQTSPRYSQGRISFRTKGIAPRFSSGSPFRSRNYRIAPRYSSGSPFRSAQYRLTPRYSRGNPFRGSDYRISPRYSRGNPFRGSDYRISPRYSRGNPFRGSDYRISPRYSRGNPFRGSDYRISPRYSRGNPFRGARYRVSPRYSQGMPFESFYFKKVKPRYSNPKNRFVINPTYRKTHRYYNVTAGYKGTMKLAKRGSGDQHPSSNYHFAMKFTNPKIRKMFRKWNIFWVRVNGNKEQPKGVKASVRSPKFDKKEKDIWNN